MTHTPTIGGMFTADTRDHQLTIINDQGPHKHLRAHTTDPDTGRPLHLYSVDLVLWPGRAALSGDLDGFTLRADLPTLRGATQDGGISWQYLAEKVDAGKQNVTGFSGEVFRREVYDHVARDIRDRTAPRGIGRALRDQVFDAWEYNLDHAVDAQEALARFEFEGYRISDAEWDCTDFTSDFERAVLGLQLVIGLYDRELADRAATQADRADLEHPAPV